MARDRRRNTANSAGAVLCLAALIAVAGCSGNKVSDQADQSTNAPGSREPSPAAAPAPTEHAETAEGPRTISGIPLDVWPDVWFDDPVAVAADAAQAAKPGQTTTNGDTAESQPDVTAADDSPADKPNPNQPQWASLLTSEELKQETKEIRISLKQAFQSVQRYNGHYKNVSVDGSVLAVLAMVANESPDSLVWKKKALVIRDLAAEMSAAAGGLGRKHYDPALVHYEQIDQLLSGNAPAKLPAPKVEATFDEFAPRGELMKRLQRSHERIQANASDERSFQAEAEQLRHESLVVALLGAVTSLEDYDMSDEPEYAAQARNIVQAGLDAARSAERSDFEAFSEARERITKSCTACHLDFRFDEE